MAILPSFIAKGFTAINYCGLCFRLSVSLVICICSLGEICFTAFFLTGRKENVGVCLPSSADVHLYDAQQLFRDLGLPAGHVLTDDPIIFDDRTAVRGAFIRSPYAVSCPLSRGSRCRRRRRVLPRCATSIYRRLSTTYRSKSWLLCVVALSPRPSFRLFSRDLLACATTVPLSCCLTQVRTVHTCIRLGRCQV